MTAPDEVPVWLWRSVRTALGITIAGGLIAVIVLAAGAADPPRAGPRRYENSTAHTLIARANSGTQFEPESVVLPNGAFTLEVSGRLSPDSDPSAAWGIELSDDQTRYSALLNGFRQYAVMPSQPDFAPFIHVRADGESNKITLDVRGDSSATMRINDEVAWTGRIGAVRSAHIQVIGGLDKSAALTVEGVAVYAP